MANLSKAAQAAAAAAQLAQIRQDAARWSVTAAAGGGGGGGSSSGGGSGSVVAASGSPQGLDGQNIYAVRKFSQSLHSFPLFKQSPLTRQIKNFFFRENMEYK